MCMYIYILYVDNSREVYQSTSLPIYIFHSPSGRISFFIFPSFKLKIFLSMVSTPVVGIPGDTYRHGGLQIVAVPRVK